MELTTEWCSDDVILKADLEVSIKEIPRDGIFPLDFGILQKIFGKQVYDTYIDVEQGISSC